MAYGANGNTKSNGNAFVSEFKIKEQMCEIGRRIWLKGFCAGNQGNHSYRIGENRGLCTPTGISKGCLKPEDICSTDIEGRQLGGARKPARQGLRHLAACNGGADINALR